MRNVFVIFGIIATAGITFSITTLRHINVDIHQNSDSIKISKTPLAEKDLKNIQNIISKKSLHSQFNNSIFDLSKSSSEVTTQNNYQEIIAVANDNLASLFDCYVKPKCEAPKSVIETMISRHLELVKDAIKREASSSQTVNWIVIRECSGINNSSIRILSDDLLRNYDNHNNGAVKILNIASSYKGKAKAEFFKTVVEIATNDERKFIISALRESFIKDDSKTVELIVENMDAMNLKKIEIAGLEKNLCHFKTKENWNKIKMAMSSVSSDFEKICL